MKLAFASRVRSLLPEILLVAFTTAVGFWAAGRWIDPVGDPGLSWSLAYRIAHGERLYRDVYFAYGPLSPYLLAAWVRVFGASSLSFLLLNWIPAIAAALLLMQAVRRFLSPLERLALAGMIVATSLFAPGAGRLVLPYYAGVVHALILSLGAILLISRSPRWRWQTPALAGGLAGLAFCCKQEVGIAALAGLLIAAFAGVERPLKWSGFVLGGFAGVALLAAAFALSSAPLDSLRDRSRLWPLRLRPPAEFDYLFRSVSGLGERDWFLAWRGAAWRVLTYIAVFGVLGGLLAREASPRAWRRLFWLAGCLAIWFAIERFPLSGSASPVRLSVAVSATLSLVALSSPRLEGRPLIAAIGVFAALTGLRALVSPFESGPYDGPAHFAAAASWALVLLMAVPRLLWPSPSSERAARWTRTTLAVALTLFFWWTAAGNATSLRFDWKEAAETPVGPVYTDRGHATMFREIGRRVVGGERVLVLPEINAVDALFGLGTPSPLLDNLPGWLDHETEAGVIARLEKSPPAKIIIFERPTAEFGVQPFGRGFGLSLSEWCNRRYRKVWSSKGGTILELMSSNPSQFPSQTVGDR